MAHDCWFIGFCQKDKMDWHFVAEIGIYILVGVICLVGLVLSALSLSGTWAILLGTGILTWFFWPDFPGLQTFLLFLLLCIGVEILEFFAGNWGVRKRGGSKAAGLAALGGGFLGMILGGFVVPLAGNILGMLLGSFIAAFLVEYNRVKTTATASYIAFGAVMARLGVLFLKVGISLVMIIILVAGLILSRTY